MAGLVLTPVAAALPWIVSPSDLSAPGRRMLAVFLVAIVLWVTEAIPLHATAVVVIAAEILLVSDQAVLPLPPDFEPPAFAGFYGALANPVIVLFLGGFFLADGAAKFRLDRNLAGLLLRPFGRSPRAIMLGLMVVTAALSMFMSNTATTATMMAVVLPLLAGLPAGDRLRTGFALAIPIAANVGGLATPVGSPPNAIALGALASSGIRLTFIGWVGMLLPFVIVLLLFAWWLLGRLFPPGAATVDVDLEPDFVRSRPATVFYVTAAATVLLWCTEPLHGIPATIVGFLPVVVLLSTGVMDANDLRALRWDVLWLVAGGIALAAGVEATGLDAWMVGLVEWGALPGLLLLLVLGAVALGLSTIISNSATANLLVPLGIALGASAGVAVEPVAAAVLIAAGCSLAMALPISTPPNAIAYATGLVSTRQLAVTGAAVGTAGLLLVVAVAPWVWRQLGMLGP